jgi:hypothetical protein
MFFKTPCACVACVLRMAPEATSKLQRECLQVEKAPMPGARFRATAAAATIHDGTRAVMVFGGHHRCERMPALDNPDDDGGCDEIAVVAAFFEAKTAPIYVYEAGAGADTTAAQAQAAVVSPLAALTGYRMTGSLSAGGGFWATKSMLPTARSDFHVRVHATPLLSFFLLKKQSVCSCQLLSLPSQALLVVWD